MYSNLLVIKHVDESSSHVERVDFVNAIITIDDHNFITQQSYLSCIVYDYLRKIM